MNVLNSTTPGMTGISLDLDEPGFATVEDLCRKAFGFRLFTILANDPGAGEICRIYSSNPADYPPGGRKPMGRTPWGEGVLRRGRAWLGDGEDALRWAFPDAALILSLGCEACACAPVRQGDRVIGVLSLCDVRGSYAAEDLNGLGALAQLLVAPLGQL